jgi:nucleotide-binding universal stress UspA family protein
MTSKEIRHILCAVRGVPKSRDTVTKAIELALAHNARLTFMHVTDAEFMTAVRPSMTSLRTVYQQLHNLGEFTLMVLCDRAQRYGVNDTDFLIREGKLIPQLKQVLSEMRPDLLVIGKPVNKTSSPRAIESDELEQFTQEVETNLNIPVVSVEIDIID